MGPTLPGLAWLVVGIATAALGLLGALVQALVLGLHAPAGARGAHVRAGLAGPLVGTAVALACALSIDQFSGATKSRLDELWFLLPLAALVSWLLVNRALIRKLAPREGATSPSPSASDR